CGIKYTIIEGFKEKGYRKIVFGDLEDVDAFMRNPAVDEVAGSLDTFDGYFTMQGLVAELKEEADIPKCGAILTYTGIVREITGEETTEYMDFKDNELIDAVTREIENTILAIPGIRGAKLYHRRGRLYAGDDVLYVAIAASHRKEGFDAMMEAINEFKAKLH
ncbi:MAG: molybdenum cofactor biosynthesis protein MoaE, partial [Spirochaetales bacterium]|nr:molybdenum cofactor biosynthesis protein MoaE [Spirochaetales bacterium]